MLARAAAAIANLLLAAFAALLAVPTHGLALAGAIIGVALTLSVAVDLAHGLGALRPRGARRRAS